MVIIISAYALSYEYVFSLVGISFVSGVVCYFYFLIVRGAGDARLVTVFSSTLEYGWSHVCTCFVFLLDQVWFLVRSFL